MFDLLEFIHIHGIGEGWFGLIAMTLMVTVFPAFCYGLRTWALKGQNGRRKG